MKKYITGVDIGGTNTVIGLIDENGLLISKISFPTKGHDSAETFLKKLAGHIHVLLDEYKDQGKLCGIGIGAPNGNFYSGCIEFAPNLEWEGIINVTEYLKRFFPEIPIALTNDANAAAIGEMIYGDAQNVNDFIMVTLGTGVGSGIVVNGQLVYGHDGFAGEIGHTIYDPHGRFCGCGRQGCLETYTSASGIVRTAFEIMAKCNNPSVLRNYTYEELDSEIIANSALKGDEIANSVYNTTARILAIKLADSVAHTSPKCIFIFGGVAKAGELLLQPLRAYLEIYLLKIFRNKIEIRLSGLDENNAAILGAAALIKNAIHNL